MNKSQYLQHQQVQAFMSWMAENALALPIHLKVKKSRFVPVAIDQQCVGFRDILDHYTWKAEGMVTGDWLETQVRVTNLANRLRQTIDHGTDDEVLEACKEILQWGGNRDYKKGAFPFLSAKRSDLRHYLKTAREAFALATADTDQLVGPTKPIESMNSMLTKVHSFLAQDGLPIYDSRVAAAMATLVEWWRYQAAQTNIALADELKFPVLTRTRTVHRLFPEAQSPGLLRYGQPDTVADWCKAKVRLGWLIEGILQQYSIWGNLPIAHQMRCFEAVLFMIGYDVQCLATDMKTKTLWADSRVLSSKSNGHKSSQYSRLIEYAG